MEWNGMLSSPCDGSLGTMEMLKDPFDLLNAIPD